MKILIMPVLSANDPHRDKIEELRELKLIKPLHRTSIL